MTRRSNGGNERGSAAQSAPERGFGQVGRRDHMAPLLSALVLSSCPRYLFCFSMSALREQPVVV